jgi:4-azaleucine resistance transporter AzlC
MGFAWYIPILMSIFIYSGALQFLLIGILKDITLIDIFLTSLLLNSRQIFYGLSFLNRFKKFKWYLIFALTDETYLLLSSTPKDLKDRDNYYIFVSALNHLYWIGGTILGVAFASGVEFDIKGLDFILVALFVVLAIEQFKNTKELSPFIIGAIAFIGTSLLGLHNIFFPIMVAGLILLFKVEK